MCMYMCTYKHVPLRALIYTHVADNNIIPRETVHVCVLEHAHVATRRAHAHHTYTCIRTLYSDVYLYTCISRNTFYTQIHMYIVHVYTCKY